MRRFFVDPVNIGDKTILINDRDDLHHMIKVLRLSEGDEIEISDSVEWEYRAKIISIGSEYAEADIIDKQRFASEPRIKVTLFQGVPKQGKMETIVQKAVELGVCKIVPVFMDRSVSVDNGKFRKKRERWQKISDEAVKQCRRGIIPAVADAVTVREMIGEFDDFDMVIFSYEGEEYVTIKDVLRTETDRCIKYKDDGSCIDDIAVIIGPEGGFSAAEADAITESGGMPVSLGKTVLRTETAGMAAIAMIMYEMEL